MQMTVSGICELLQNVGEKIFHFKFFKILFFDKFHGFHLIVFQGYFVIICTIQLQRKQKQNSKLNHIKIENLISVYSTIHSQTFSPIFYHST